MITKLEHQRKPKWKENSIEITSGYFARHPTKLSNILGKIKDESEGKIIGKFVGWKAKIYSMKIIDGKESNTAKGVNIATELKEIKFHLYF